MRKILKSCIEFVKMPRNMIWSVLHGITYRASWRFYGLPLIRPCGKGSRILIGERFMAVSKMRCNTFGILHPVSIRTSCPGALIEIGDDVGISGAAISAAKHIRIGNRVLIGSGVVIADNDSHPIDYRDRINGLSPNAEQVIIEDDVFIGARAMILKGVRIGRGAVVGAGSVVVKDVPEMVVVAGNPARVVKKIAS